MRFTLSASGLDEVTNSSDHELRFVELNPVRAAGRDDMSAAHRFFGKASMCRELFSGLIRTRDDDERYFTRWSRRCNGFAIAFQRGQVIGHCVKALGIAPQRLHDGMNLRRQLLDFTNQSFQRSCRSRTEDSDEPARRAWRAAGEQRQACADDADACQYRANA